MADRVEDQAPKPEDERAKTVASNRSVEDAYSSFQASEGSPETSAILSVRVKSDAEIKPAKLPSDGAKPDPDAGARSKVAPDNSGATPRESQASKDAVVPSTHPVEKVIDPAAKPAVVPKPGEQASASTDGNPRIQNPADQPTSQRPADAIPAQPVAKVPERSPDKLASAPAEQPSDRAHLPGLAIVGPEAKAQQGNAGTVGTSDGRVHDPAVVRPQDATATKAHDPTIAKAQEALGGKVHDTGLRGGEPGSGALTGKIQAGPDQVRSVDAVGRPSTQSGDVHARPANGESVLKNYSAADGTRSGIDHTAQGIIAKGIDGKGIDGKGIDGKGSEGSRADGKSSDVRGDGTRSGPVSLTDGKIADGKVDGERGQTRLPDGRMPDGKIADGKASGVRPGEVKLTDGKIGDGKTSDGKSPESKVGGGGGPSAFIQFIESQAGARGFGLPAKSDGNKSEGKTDSKTDGAKGNIGPDGKPASGDTKSGAGIPSGRSNAIDGFLGLVETVKDNIKGSLKNLGDRTQPVIPLKEGELAAVAMRGKMPPLRDDITSEQILAVLIPKGLVAWSIVRAPGIRPSDSPLPGSKTKIDGVKLVDGKPLDTKQTDTKQGAPKPVDAKQAEAKPFDINNPDAKSRPFIQLHGVDSSYTGAGVRRTEPAAEVKSDQSKVEPPKPDQIKIEPSRLDQIKVDQSKPIPVKAEPFTDTKVAGTAAATPYLDVSQNSQIVDQSATRQTIPREPKTRQQLIDEQEHTLPSASETDFEISDSKEKSEPLPLELTQPSEGEKRLRYVNSALDAQEATWNSEDDDANNGQELQAPLGRYTYIVRAGDTVESVAVVELNDLSLAPLLFKKNKKYVLPEEEYGRHPLVAGVVIDLPTPAEIKAFRQF